MALLKQSDKLVGGVVITLFLLFCLSLYSIIPQGDKDKNNSNGIGGFIKFVFMVGLGIITLVANLILSIPYMLYHR